MTATEFRAQHGDPTTWTTADMESFEHLAEIDALPTHTPDVPAEASAPATA
ncbi:hypothetical protein [Streptomyces sp. NPDC056192]|uniref:hypothetical protein n=1 Tax=Streptomyces sp. NPDC056192 TaxID=3345743 RepID=UPI0035D56785